MEYIEAVDDVAEDGVFGIQVRARSESNEESARTGLLVAFVLLPRPLL